MRFLSLRPSVAVLVLAIGSFLYPECETNEGGRECFCQDDFVRGTHVILLPSRTKWCQQYIQLRAEVILHHGVGHTRSCHESNMVISHKICHYVSVI